MWALYKRTFVGMQIVIAIVAMGTFVLTRHWQPALMMFSVMQISAVFGARWGVRVRNMVRQDNDRLPLHSGS
jgi:hypothetical protein